MTVYALYFCLVVALALFYCLTRCFKAIDKKNKEISKLQFRVKELERQAQELRSWTLNDVTSSQIDFSSVTTSEQVDEYNMSAVIENQHTIINNQNITISYLGTICFLITISIGIYLVIKFGKWIYSLIN